MQQSNDRPHPGGGGPADVGYDDPWYDALASGWGESAGTGVPTAVHPALPAVRPTEEPAARRQEGAASAADVYLQVQRSAAFQEVRSRYRRFVVPAVFVFCAWYVAYVVTATAAPDLMARPVAGAVNVGLLAGLGQFLTTFLLTWAYTRHARLRRDRAALELRWDTQELARERGGVS
ncbi:DUF485 domain-containing protein [Streptomyces sp. M2CJ-2]|uniref:DUF485 domain-containing protein n=1 Tax=Streptomyces sp. M2CJ-2 TaxID=2803948 RepID=UPI0019286024|nr:DUF485 domain-containing protein [Streptomyces sp. M2CJ-2]MBL3666852.1 DUF485 domain-containing protein [Streptomyces sp. M2CJ-2]